MIDWCGHDLHQCVLICLDHDLGPNRNCAGIVFDPGTGRDVADYLATRPPTCPVLIHTTNALAAPGMQMALEDTGWSCYRVSPYEDRLWIREIWIRTVLQSLPRM